MGERWIVDDIRPIRPWTDFAVCDDPRPHSPPDIRVAGAGGGCACESAVPPCREGWKGEISRLAGTCEAENRAHIFRGVFGASFSLMQVLVMSCRSIPGPRSCPGVDPSPRPPLFLVRESGPDWSSHDALDDDRLDDLADEITTLAAHIHAATARLLELIAEFDRHRGWAREGHRSCAHWLAFRTGIALGAAREKVRAARALTELPETAAAMARGELSFSKVRALTRVATPDTEAGLLELARGCTTAQTERIVRAWKRYDHAEEADIERELHASRTFSVFPDDEGMYVVRGRLPAEVGALLMRAIEAASDAIFRGVDAPGMEDAGAGAGDPARSRDVTSRAAARRRADALALLAERAMAAGFGGGNDGESEVDVPISGTRAERYQVVLHVSAETLSAAESRAVGDSAAVEGGGSCDCEGGSAAVDGTDTCVSDRSSHLEDGTRVSAETSRRLCCDAAVVRVEHGTRDGGRGGYVRSGHVRSGHTRSEHTRSEPLSVGRRTRTIPPALRRALELRDGGCRFPGCGLRFTDAHHIRHWADGGETSLANCILLCRHHHRLVHEGGWRVQAAAAGGSEGRGTGAAPTFIDPRGGLHYEGRWRPPTLPPGVIQDAARALAEQNRDRGADPGPLTPSARWRRDRDIPDAVHFAALEALA